MDLLLGCAAGLHSPRDAGTSSRSPVNRHSWARVAEHRVGPTGRRRHTTSGGARCCPLGTTQTFPPRRSTREPPGGSARGRCSRAGSLLRPRWAGVSPIEARAHGCCHRPAGGDARTIVLSWRSRAQICCVFFITALVTLVLSFGTRVTRLVQRASERALAPGQGHSLFYPLGGLLGGLAQPAHQVAQAEFC